MLPVLALLEHFIEGQPILINALSSKVIEPKLPALPGLGGPGEQRLKLHLAYIEFLTGFGGPGRVSTKPILSTLVTVQYCSRSSFQRTARFGGPEQSKYKRSTARWPKGHQPKG